MDVELFDYSPIVEREPIQWPGGARVAFYMGLNVEHFYVDRPSTSLNEATAGLVPDPLNYGWRDYGARVAIWRLMETFDRHGIRASALLNADVGERYPQIVEAGRARDWAWVAHGKTPACTPTCPSRRSARSSPTSWTRSSGPPASVRAGGWGRA